MSAATFVDIANAALIKLGVKTIMSFDDNSTEANVVKERYEACRDIVLRMYPWNCATQRVTLAQLTMGPAFGYAYQYSLPADCLKVLGVSYGGVDDDRQGSYSVNYKIEGRTLLSDQTSIALRYIYAVSDATVLDPLVADCISCWLAMDVSRKLTPSTISRDTLRKEFYDQFKLAKNADSQEQVSRRLNFAHFEHARVGSYGSAAWRSVGYI